MIFLDTDNLITIPFTLISFYTNMIHFIFNIQKESPKPQHLSDSKPNFLTNIIMNLITLSLVHYQAQLL